MYFSWQKSKFVTAKKAATTDSPFKCPWVEHNYKDHEDHARTTKFILPNNKLLRSSGVARAYQGGRVTHPAGQNEDEN